MSGQWKIGQVVTSLIKLVKVANNGKLVSVIFFTCCFKGIKPVGNGAWLVHREPWLQGTVCPGLDSSLTHYFLFINSKLKKINTSILSFLFPWTSSCLLQKSCPTRLKANWLNHRKVPIFDPFTYKKRQFYMVPPNVFWNQRWWGLVYNIRYNFTWN